MIPSITYPLLGVPRSLDIHCTDYSVGTIAIACLIDVGVEHVVIPVYHESIHSLRRSGRGWLIGKQHYCERPKNCEEHGRGETEVHGGCCVDGWCWVHKEQAKVVVGGAKSNHVRVCEMPAASPTKIENESCDLLISRKGCSTTTLIIVKYNLTVHYLCFTAFYTSCAHAFKFLCESPLHTLLPHSSFFQCLQYPLLKP